jgi:cytochrome c553
LLALTFATGPARAQASDPHALYEESCARCHGAHAADLAHEMLVLEDGIALSRTSGEAVRRILLGGHGKLSASQADDLTDHLTAILGTGGVYRQKCLGCHDRAVRLVRGSVIVRDGRMISRYTGRDMSAFMLKHGGLTQNEVGVILEMFARQLRTASQD